MTEVLKGVLVALTAVTMAGCGGGGGGSGTTGTPGVYQAQGVAQGTTALGNSDMDIILETGEFYNFVTAAGIALTVDHGTMLESGAGIAANLMEFNVAANTASSGAMTGLFIAQSAITGTIALNINQYTPYTGTNPVSLYQYTTFSANYLPGYNNAANLATLTGTYSGVYTYGGAPVTMTLSATGAISGTSTNCAISGTATPRASGKNVFNVSLTLTGANCTPAGVGSASGIAVLNPENGLTRLYVAGLNATGSNGFFWVGTRQ
jgi:hypothetical protein